MIADEIRGAVASMKDALRDGELPWPLFSSACQQLLAAADKAAALERLAVPAPARATGSADTAASVVDFTRYRARRRPRPTLVRNDGGPAA